ncbi:threonylcarbamoyl-AMP synthase [Candidatus Microgenomates bacterium]|nr:threonylcarbamoyl-AMP synthase [Candidatus Microgenomates bacterium]
MQKLKVDSENPENSIIEQAAEKLKNGGIVVCPNDTVYIFAADATDPVAIGRVYDLKGRDCAKPIHVIVKNWEMVKDLCETNETAMKLYNEFLPGPLTIILKKKSVVPDILTANLPTLGIRIPNNPTTRAISNLVDFPYTATSANKSGEQNTYTAQEVLDQLDEKDQALVDFIIDTGELPKVDPSTIIDCSLRLRSGQASPAKILRPGPITQGQIESVLGMKVQ